MRNQWGRFIRNEKGSFTLKAKCGKDPHPEASADACWRRRERGQGIQWGDWVPYPQVDEGGTSEE